PRAFDAAWSMSTLVHVADADFDRAMDAIAATVVPGSPIALGLWGGRDQEGRQEEDHFDPPRFYSLRRHDRVQAMLEAHGTVIRFETHDPGLAEGWEYQLAIVRTPG
ncbi:MAG: class I SAM-dependent methyltransferase, partial [Actinomycetota bacterium]